MGKNLIQQRRGKGTPRYLSPGHRFLGKVRYPSELYGGVKEGVVVDVLHAPGRTAPVAVVDFSGKRELMIPTEGLYVGQIIQFGGKPERGNIVSLADVPEGTKIFNIELNPGDGGKLCRSSGSFSIMMGRERNRCIVKLPSGHKKVLSSHCLASVGSVAGAGRVEKPFVKAGAKFHKLHAFGKRYPTVRGVAMNPVDHPFGGSAHPGKQKSISRNAPPGRKVGSISPKRTGKRKRKK